MPWAARSYARAWRSYIRGNVVSEYSARLIQSFLTILSGTGKLEHDEENVAGGRLLRKDLGSPGERLSVSDVRGVLTAKTTKAPARDGKGSKIAKRIEGAMGLVPRLVTTNSASLNTSVNEDTRASRYHRVNSSARGSTNSDSTKTLTQAARAEVERGRLVPSTV